ncbi:helix-turn-helix domain-containing protein [Bergeyella sp. RCAD1439]|uniref:helix-turn-helix domain-containing protein n=1 Tax=Bergeyella anatis TaxID=3113737 RepID=UPI002E18FE98|nr:helix-turn-helix transcriptional regulator [Bergeyella sp. RCAD1439]
MSLNERVTQIIAYSGLSASVFADTIEVPRATISHIASGRNKPSLDFLMKVKEQFPEIGWDWLINGEGDMLLPPLTQTSEKEETSKPSSPLPDLFTIIDDEHFGKEAPQNKKEAPSPVLSQSSETSRESPIAPPSQASEKIDDSQRLAEKESPTVKQSTENQENKIKRIVFFFEDGTFESFEP